MTTLDSPIAVQLPSRDHAYETLGHVSSYTSSTQNHVAHRQSSVAPSSTSDYSAPLTSEIRHKNAYRRWRPRYHLMAPTGWLNDPCAPGYDPAHDVYHVGFQWNPKKPEWGDISWGSALSKDLLFWETDKLPSIKPSTKHDGEAGVFTGCWSPVNAVPGKSTVFYTSARMLPIHHTLPYNWGSEAICIATSTDAGRTWKRGNSPTVLLGPPRHLEVTGWRDPFVAAWPSLSRLIGEDPHRGIFGLVSGGVRDSGPAVFLYSVDPNDLAIWNFLSVLTIAPTSRDTRISHWEPDYGANWEVVNFLSLDDPDDPALSHDVLIIGVEGRSQLLTQTSGRLHHSDFRRDHCQMWISGDLVKKSDSMQMQFRFGGALDYGGIYAANSFRDPKSNQHVVFGWIVEEDLPVDLREAQGWAGLLSIPRVVQLNRIRHVVHALKSELTSIKSLDVVLESDQPQNKGLMPAKYLQTYTVTTLSALPDPRLKELRQMQRFLGPSTHRSQQGSLGSLEFPLGCSCWEADVSFELGADVERIGFIISHTKDSALRTVISFSAESETLSVVRANSTNIEDICVADEEAPHTLFSTLSSATVAGDKPSFALEPLQLTVFFDVSCLELFANKRTAITTRVYPESMTCFDIQPFVTTKGQHPWSGRLLECTAWELKTSPS
ncbi:glycosyl hydrolases family 32 superfamily [Fusarium beomiforme]|uniref:Glycosyl hydrolases family 32 superfamily n=1 Tax=Fusarium beomiforme TaxID=44412 RepID=A0A9P5DTM9_9HYPO|nr:glycosyl hydrolases family 32 superfamily [Fusarium beomiforme]